MNIDEVKAMTEEELWDAVYDKLPAGARLCFRFSEAEDAAELRADIERRGMQVGFMDNLRRVIPAGSDLSVIYLTSGIAVEYLFRLCNASPRQVAEAYLMTVLEEL